MSLGHFVARFHKNLEDVARHGGLHGFACDGGVVVHGLFFFLGLRVRMGGFPTGLLLLQQELLGHGGEEFEQEDFFFVLSQFHSTEIGKSRVGLHCVLGRVVGDFFPSSCDLETESRVYGHRCLSIFSFYEGDELVRLVGVHRFAVFDVHGAVHSLRADNLACRSHQRRKSGRQAHGRDELHGLVKNFHGVQLLQLSHHVCVHAARDFCLFDFLVWFREVEISLDGVASVQQCFFIVGFGGLDGFVEFFVDILRQFVRKRIERIREYLDGVVCLEFFPDSVEFFVDFCDGLHVDVQFHSEFLAEDIDKLDGRSGGTSGEIPNVGVNDVHSVHNGRKHGSQSVTRGTVGVEVNGYAQVLLEEADETCHSAWVDESAHVLDGDHVGAQGLHFLCFVQKVFVRKHRVGVLFPFQLLHQAEFRVFGVDGVTYGAISDTSILFNVFDGRFHVVHIIQRIEYTHDT